MIKNTKYMKTTYLIISFLLLSLSVIAQAETIFVMGAEFGVVTYINDSTFQVDIEHPADQLGQGYLPTQILTGDRLFDINGRLFRVSSIITANFGESTLQVVELQDNNIGPVGVGVVYRKPDNSDCVPIIPQGNTGLSPAIVAKIHNHNAVVGCGGGTDDQTASEVPIVDAGGYYVATEVEAALQEEAVNRIAVDLLVGDLISLTGVPFSSTTMGAFVNNLLPDNEDIKTIFEVFADSVSEIKSQIEGIAYDNVAFINNSTGTTGTVGLLLDPYSINEALTTADTVAKYHLSGTAIVNSPFTAPLDFYSSGFVRFVRNTTATLSTLSALGGEEYNYIFNKVEFSGARFFAIEAGNATNTVIFKANDAIFKDAARVRFPSALVEIGNLKAENQGTDFCFWIGPSAGGYSNLKIGRADLTNSRLLSALTTFTGSSISQNNGIEYSINIGTFKLNGWGQLMSSSFSSSDMRNASVYLRVENVVNEVDASDAMTYTKYANIDPSHLVKAPRWLTLGTESAATADSTVYNIDLINVNTHQTILCQSTTTTNSTFIINIDKGVFKGTPAIHTQDGGGVNNEFIFSCNDCLSTSTPAISITGADSVTTVKGNWESIGEPCIISNKDFTIQDAFIQSDSFLVDANTPINVFVRNTNVNQSNVGPNVTVIVLDEKWISETFTATAAQTDFTVSAGQLPTDGANVRVYDDTGAKLRETDHYTYVAATGVVTLITPATAGEKYTIEYFQ
jgi:hypothetical protein